MSTETEVVITVLRVGLLQNLANTMSPSRLDKVIEIDPQNAKSWYNKALLSSGSLALLKPKLPSPGSRSWDIQADFSPHEYV